MRSAPTVNVYRDRFVQRLVRCVAGLACFGVGIAMILDAHLGSAPWEIFHKGVASRTGLSVGTVIILTGVTLMLLWIPLRQRPGLGTLLNTLEIGAAADLALWLSPDTDRLVGRVPLLLGGVLVIAIGSGLYIGAGLGAGPRDGLMVGLSARFGISVRVARTAVEGSAALAGVLLGGPLGLGTVVFLVSIGPCVQFLLPRLAMSPPTSV